MLHRRTETPAAIYTMDNARCLHAGTEDVGDPGTSACALQQTVEDCAELGEPVHMELLVEVPLENKWCVCGDGRPDAPTGLAFSATTVQRTWDDYLALRGCLAPGHTPAGGGAA